jgi:hypothetical protein
MENVRRAMWSALIVGLLLMWASAIVARIH